MLEGESDSAFPPQSWAGADDVIIVGGGLAGLFCALRLAPRPVTVLAAAPIGKGASSAWAQAGIAAAMGSSDSVEAHLADTIAAGAGIVAEPIAEIMVREAPARVADLMDFGVDFDRDPSGSFDTSLEAGHTAPRIVRVGGDRAGAEIMSCMIVQARETPSIRLLEGVIGEALHADGNHFTGITARLRGRPDRIFLPGRACVLAVGGSGHLYSVTTNPAESEGSGVAMAAEIGAVIADAEFVQFHPTALAVGRDPAPLATEAIRGAGAKLVDETGERFLEGVHPDRELAPRDIVARAIYLHIAEGHSVFLDARESVGARFPSAFQTVHRFCLEAGIDPITQPIPVAPAAHYHMGGVLVDAIGRSTIDGLWACGEAASTGAHGANRLASNSLLEAIVFAARIADDIQGLLPSPQSGWTDRQEAGSEIAERDEGQLVTKLRGAMTAHVGVVRHRDGLVEALRLISSLGGGNVSRRMRNRLTAAKMIAVAALWREESRGAHHRSDHPLPRAEPGKRSYLTLAEADADLAELDAGRRATAAAMAG